MAELRDPVSASLQQVGWSALEELMLLLCVVSCLPREKADFFMRELSVCVFVVSNIERESNISPKE
jgi:hypothetical protein